MIDAACLQPEPVVQSRLAHAPWHSRQGLRLPGTAQCGLSDWLRVDEAYAAQVALRDRLLATRTADVLAEDAGPAGRELLSVALDWMLARPDFIRSGDAVRRPDGQAVALDGARPLATLGRLLQQDLCLLQPRGDEYALTAAVLCFPASWALRDKLNRPLTGIHDPVAPYDADLARRVQRLFDALRPGVVLARSNALLYDDFALFQPRRAPRGPAPAWLRTERQTLRRLPDTGAVVFAIHTAVLPRAALSPEDAAGLAEYLGQEKGAYAAPTGAISGTDPSDPR